MSVDAAVAGWREYIQPLKAAKDKMYLGSPAVSNAAATDNTGLGWLEKFISACTGCSIDFINIHWYVIDAFFAFHFLHRRHRGLLLNRYDSVDNVAYLKKHIEDARRVAQGRPIWITEFKPRGTEEQVKRFLNEVMPWMDRSSDIHRYAYFMARAGEGMLINDAQSGLSGVGSYYHSHA